MKAQPTVPVRITANRYKTLRKDAKANGHSLSWLLNYIIDLYYQDKEKNADVPKFPVEAQ